MQKGIKTLDEAGKTADAWWSLLFAEGGLGRTIFRWVWPLIGASIFGYLGRMTEWVNGLGPIGIASAAVVGAICFTLLAASFETWRFRRAVRLRGYEEPAPEFASALLPDPRIDQLISETIPSLATNDELVSVLHLANEAAEFGVAFSQMRILDEDQRRIETGAEAEEQRWQQFKDQIFSGYERSRWPEDDAGLNRLSAWEKARDNVFSGSSDLVRLAGIDEARTSFAKNPFQRVPEDDRVQDDDLRQKYREAFHERQDFLRELALYKAEIIRLKSRSGMIVKGQIYRIRELKSTLTHLSRLLPREDADYTPNGEQQ